MTITREMLWCESITLNDGERCPRCGHDLARCWYNLRQTLCYLNTSRTQFNRIRRLEPIARPSFALGPRNPRWSRTDLDTAMALGRPVAGIVTIEPITGGRKTTWR